MKRRSSGGSIAATLVILAGVALAFGFLVGIVTFGRTRNLLPRNVYIGAVNVGGLTIDQAITRTVSALNEPVILRFKNQVVPMEPEKIDFVVNDAVARVALQQLIAKQQPVAMFPGWLGEQVSGRQPTRTQLDVPFNYSEFKLSTFIAGVSQQISKAIVPATTANGALVAAQDGLALDASETARLVLRALESPNDRLVDLPVDILPADGHSIKALSLVLAATLKSFDDTPGNVSAVYLKDLQTGEEVAINADLSFSSGGWLRLAVALEATRSVDPASRSALQSQLTGALISGSDSAANELLRAIGVGSIETGINQTNAVLHKLGLLSTFISAPWGAAADPVTFMTPGNARSEVAGVRLSPQAQATPSEIGLILETIDQCARSGSGALAVVFTNNIARQQCEALLSTVSQNPANTLLGAGSGATVLHRQSWTDDTHADAALVRSPGGAYIIVVALHGKSLAWNTSATLFTTLARLTYQYFNDGKTPPAVNPGPLPPPQ